jgi:hypothetical protein
VLTALAAIVYFPAAGGIILLFVARFVLRSPFFSIRRESWSPSDKTN